MATAKVHLVLYLLYTYLAKNLKGGFSGLVMGFLLECLCLLGLGLLPQLP